MARITSRENKRFVSHGFWHSAAIAPDRQSAPAERVHPSSVLILRQVMAAAIAEAQAGITAMPVCTSCDLSHRDITTKHKYLFSVISDSESLR